MTIGSKQFKNGITRGYLTFNTGKKIVLKEKEMFEFESKIREREYQAVENYKSDRIIQTED